MRLKTLLALCGIQLFTVISGLGQAAPHSLNAITVSSDRAVSLELGGRAGLQFRPYFDLYILDASRGLMEWEPLTTLLRTNSSSSPLVYVDSPPTNQEVRFYRVLANSLPTPFPKPTGNYTVGTTSVLLTDPSRTNRYNIKTNSSFMISLWFPAPPTLRALPSPYMEYQLAPKLAALYGPGPSVLSNLYSHCSGAISVATNEAPYPVVIYSHGFGVHRRDNTAKFQDLASHGYVVVSIDHADCLATVFPDGRVLSSPISTLSSALFTNDVRDVEFVLDALARMNESDPAFAHTLDLQRVGTMGWSFGGGVAAEICRTNDRVLATVLLDAYMQDADQVIRLGLEKPFLGIYSVSGGGTQVPFYLATHDAYWMQIKGTQHQHFADWLAWVSSPTTSGRSGAMAMNACLVSFFDKYLKALDDHLLDNPSAVYPEVINFAKK
jgi:pimeloyl-ACP methyl ester carboxylesterase